MAQATAPILDSTNSDVQRVSFQVRYQGQSGPARINNNPCEQRQDDRAQSAGPLPITLPSASSVTPSPGVARRGASALWGRSMAEPSGSATALPLGRPLPLLC
jgi:hypothetical protein